MHRYSITHITHGVIICQRKRKVKSDTLPPSLRLDLNGKALLMLDTDEWGPIELRIDDKETAVELLRVIVDNLGNISTVDSYTKAEGKKLKKMVEGE
jgi:hypothetical protein